jgi:ribosome-binding factor A
MTFERHRAGGHRTERVAEEIRNEVGLMLAGELKDPRLTGPMSISEVRLSPDRRTVRIYVQLECEEAERARALEGLRAASRYVRHELVERLNLRRAPEILFLVDQSDEYGQHIDDLLRRVTRSEKL